MISRIWIGAFTLAACSLAALQTATAADSSALQPKPVPKVQAVPLPYDQISFRREGVELTRYHFGPDLHRPFLFPAIGPSGREVTRMGHPHDPQGHSHHNSIWVSHFNINGTDFWGDRSEARIRHERVAKLEDGDREASAVVENTWRDKDDAVLLRETRTVTVQPSAEGEWLLILDLQFKAERDVTIGKTPFGFLGVRMAKTIGVHDGGGRILNSADGVNEKEVFWKPARWVDYSGAVAGGVIEGITLLDHPANPNHPSIFHVRDDGWMGASFSHAADVPLAKGGELKLRYGLWVHSGAPAVGQLDEVWKRFAEASGSAR